MENEEFFGKLDIKPERVKRGISGAELINWIVVNPQRTVDRYREIEDGDLLQVFDDMGRVKLNKYIVRDYDSHYNTKYCRQMYRGKSLAWVPYGVDVGFWDNLFKNHYRARLLKATKETEGED